PIHTCGLNSIRPGAGLAIRFPRFTGNYRTEKSPEDATTTRVIVELYRSQLKQLSQRQPVEAASTPRLPTDRFADGVRSSQRSETRHFYAHEYRLANMRDCVGIWRAPTA